MTRRLGLALGVVAVLVFGSVLFITGGDAEGSEARHLVEAGARLVDVRTVEEFDSGHLPGAVNIPVQELEQRMAELGPKDEVIVVYCRSGTRSARAARLIEDAGHTHVHDLGPMSRW